jgi:excisionase family DNA binding protein
VDEIAQRLRINRRTVLNLLSHNVLEGIRAGRQWRIIREAFEEFLRRGGEAPPGEPDECAPRSVVMK